MILQTERTMRNTFKCQHGLDEIFCVHSTAARVHVTLLSSMMKCFTVTLLLISLTIPATGIPLEEGPVRGRVRPRGESFDGFNITGSGLPTFAEGPTVGRRRNPRPAPIPEIPQMPPKIDETDEALNISSPNNTDEILDIQHSSPDLMPAPRRSNITNRNEANTHNTDITRSNSDIEVTSEPNSAPVIRNVNSDVNSDISEPVTTASPHDQNSPETFSEEPSEHSGSASQADFSTNDQHFNQALTTDVPANRESGFHEDKVTSNNLTPLLEFATTTESDLSRTFANEVPDSNDRLSETYTSAPATLYFTQDTSQDSGNPFTTASTDDILSSGVQEGRDQESSEEVETLKRVLQRLESLERHHRDLQKEMRQSQISMSHDILLLKEALALEKNKTAHLALQMTHMMEAINDRLINITQKWTHPMLDLNNYPMGAQGCRYSSFHRSGSATVNATSTAWAPNDNEAEMYMVTGAACSASIGARGYLERRTVPSKPELMQFRCICTESRQSAVMRTCELHLWECFR